ncbi:MAG: ATP-binding protein, partial [Thermoguttaceae bacterium]
PGESDKHFSRMRGHLKMMYHTSLVVSQTLDINRLLNRIIDLIFDWVQVDHVCVFLYNEDEKLIPKVYRVRDPDDATNEKNNTPDITNKPDISDNPDIIHGPDLTNDYKQATGDKSATNEKPSTQYNSLKVSQAILKYVLQKGEGVITNDAKMDGRWNSDSSDASDVIHEAICVPMRGRYGIIGLIYLGTYTKIGEGAEPQHRLTRDHLKLMGAIAHQTALAVEDTRYYRGMVHAERLAAIVQTVAALSHDIKNMMQGMSGGSYLIEQGIATQDMAKVAKGWEIVSKNQNKISNLVMDMLNFTKKSKPEFAHGNVNRIVGDVVELMQGRCHEPKVDLILELDESIPNFYFDEKLLSRAVTNLVTNAIDAATERINNADEFDVCENEQSNDIEADQPQHQPTVKVTTLMGEKFNRILIIVDDNGPGIISEELNQFFKPYFPSKKNSGTGLGLAITQKIMHEHNGSVIIANSPLGGARFILDLPLLLSNLGDNAHSKIKTDFHEPNSDIDDSAHGTSE